MRIVFIVLQLSQPRCIKRITSFLKDNWIVKVYGYRNGFYEENIQSLPFTINDTFYINPNQKNKIIRKYKSYQFLKDIILKENGNETIFYLMGAHIGIFGSFFKIKYIYEESDIEAIKHRNPIIRAFLLRLDRRVQKKSLVNVFTSEGFAEYFYGDKRPDNLVVIPNKLNELFNTYDRNVAVKKTIDQNHIKFGFIGIIRYPNTILRFARIIAEEFPNHEFHFWGQPACKDFGVLKQRNYLNIFYHGTFRNPEDLPSIYQQIDISIACYDTISGNVKVAEPNKLYESIFFACPIIVSKNTFLGKKVDMLSVGYVVDASKDENIIKLVDTINNKNYQSLVSNAMNINSIELIDNPIDLINLIKKNLNNQPLWNN